MKTILSLLSLLFLTSCSSYVQPYDEYHLMYNDCYEHVKLHNHLDHHYHHNH